MPDNILYQKTGYCNSRRRNKRKKRRKFSSFLRYFLTFLIAFLIPVAGVPREDIISGGDFCDLPLIPPSLDAPSRAEPTSVAPLPFYLDRKLLDVPLTEKQQYFVFDMAHKYGVDPIMVFGIMCTETNYDEKAVSPNGMDIGIMQVNRNNAEWLEEKLGTGDLLEFEDCVESGIFIISLYCKKYEDISKILMCYHYGETGAKRLWEKGITTDSYCGKVATEMDRILSS